MPEALTNDQDRDAINIIRGLAIDAPLYAKSGHQGTAMALAPLAHVLYSRVMHHDPASPGWRNRDRFILSNGHASILQYSLLMLNGYGLELDDIRQFRQWGSATPGHPEAGHTAGIEVTTGPLGQGFANAVGMAMAESNLRARFGADVIDHHTFVLAGDGCLMEGVSHEAASLAGHLGLGRLIAVYDDNHITIDGESELALSDDAGKRFEAYGWHVEHLGEVADDLDALEAGIRRAMAVDDRPSLLILRSHIAFPSPDHTDNHEAHGNPFTAEDASRAKVAMGMPDEPYWAPTDVVDGLRAYAASRGSAARAASDQRATGWTGNTDEWEACWADGTLADWSAALPTFADGDKVATRVALAKTLSAGLSQFPGLLAGSADLTGNTGVKLDGAAGFSATNPAGRQVHYGVREHAMGSAMVGMALHGGVSPAGGTFFVFSDYMKPAIRLAALSQARVLFVFSHDSVGVGEDGPTHQPVEQLAALRAIPGLQVIRPADANETVAAVRCAVAHHGPTALILSRQAIPVCTDGSAVEAGAAVIAGAGDDPDVILVGTGSEVHVCIAAATKLAESGTTARVVSMPSWDRFAARSTDARAEVFPAGVPVVSVEAASTFGWATWADASVGIDRFGASAPGGTVLTNLGITADNVTAVAQALLSR